MKFSIEDGVKLTKKEERKFTKLPSELNRRLEECRRPQSIKSYMIDKTAYYSSNFELMFWVACIKDMYNDIKTNKSELISSQGPIKLNKNKENSKFSEKIRRYKKNIRQVKRNLLLSPGSRDLRAKRPENMNLVESNLKAESPHQAEQKMGLNL